MDTSTIADKYILEHAWPKMPGPAAGIELFIPPEEKCIEYLEKLRWPNGKIVCPYCGKTLIKKHSWYIRAGAKIKRYLCLNPECGRTFTVLTGTIFANHKMKLGEMFYIIWNLPHKSIKQIAEELGRKYEHVHRFAMDVMKICKGKIDMLKLVKAIEIDEIYANAESKKRGAKRKSEARNQEKKAEKTKEKGQRNLPEWQTADNNHV